MPDCYKEPLGVAFDGGFPVNRGYAVSIANAYCWDISFGRVGVQVLQLTIPIVPAPYASSSDISAKPVA